MKRYVIYNIETGKIVCANACSGSKQLPKQGPIGDDLVVLHGEGDATTDRVEHGRIVPQSKLQQRIQIDKAGWDAFKIVRSRLLDSKDYLLAAHYPSTDEARAAVLEKFQQSRDIPNATNDPEEALRRLTQIWSTT